MTIGARIVDTADARHVKARAECGVCLEIAPNVTVKEAHPALATGNLFLGFQLSVGDSVRPAG